MKTAIITLLIGIALVFLSMGCGDSPVTSDKLSDKNQQVSSREYDKGTSLNSGSFVFVQEYGFCDTACIAENVIIGDYILPYITECYLRNVSTGDTVYNGLYQSNFYLFYDTPNTVNVDFGNGQYKTYHGQGVDTLKYFCNQNYEVIICYE